LRIVPLPGSLLGMVKMTNRPLTDIRYQLAIARHRRSPISFSANKPRLR
jgi:hypothetical protein